MSTLVVETSISVAAAPSAAWDVISDFERNPQWQKGMKSCTWLTDPPPAIGSCYQQHAKFLGRDIVTVFEVTELEAGHRVTIDTVEGTFPMTVTRSVTADGEGCIITANVTGEAGGIFGLLTPLTRPMVKLTRPMVKRSVNSDYRRLKAMLEA